MKTISTVNGQISSDQLGCTLAHEHLFVHDEGFTAHYPHLWDRNAAIKLARQKLRAAYEAGVRTIMDMSVPGNGRNIRDIAEAAEGCPIQVIAATGVFYPNQLPGYFHTQEIDVLTGCMVRELTVGIAGSSIKAGIIKVCTDLPGLTPDVEKSLRAAARAHLETWAPIHTHSHAANESGLLQLRIFAEEGVNLQNVYIGHVMDSENLDYPHKLLERGAYIGFDRFASAPPDSPKIKNAISMLVQLCREGYADQILIGNDGCAWQTVVRYPQPEKSPSLEGNDYLTFHQHVIPPLLEAGVTEEQLTRMTTNNPKRLFDCKSQNGGYEL